MIHLSPRKSKKQVIANFGLFVGYFERFTNLKSEFARELCYIVLEGMLKYVFCGQVQSFV